MVGAIPPLPLAPTILHTSAYEDGTDKRFRNVGNYKPDAGELPYRKFTIYGLQLYWRK